MQTSRLLTIAAAASLLTVGLVWHVLESEEPDGDSVVSTTPGDNTHQSLQKEARSAPSTSHVVETRETVKTASAAEAGNRRRALVPTAIRPAHRPPATAPVTQSISSAPPADRGRFVESVQDQPSQPAKALQGIPYESEFAPIYPPVHTGRVNPGAMVLELDPGIKVPATVLDNSEVLTPAQAKAKDLVTEEFANEIVKSSEQPKANKRSNSASDVGEAAWLQARQKADERYRSLFGDEAYNRATMQASLEAMQ